METSSFDQILNVIMTYGLNVIGGIVILIVGWVAANRIAALARSQLSKTEKVDDTLTGFFSGLIKYVILAFVIIAVLNQFGVQTTSLIAIFGAAGLAVGLALQGTLSNVAAGIMLLIFRPIKVGQFVEVGGKSGTVKELSLFTTELATPDNVQIILPNSSIWGSAITNYSHHETRRVEWIMSISYDGDIEKAFQTIGEVLDGDSRILPEPKTNIVVHELADSSVNLRIRAWVNADDFWRVKFDLARQFKEAFDREGLVIPFPQQDVHVTQTNSGSYPAN